MSLPRRGLTATLLLAFLSLPALAAPESKPLHWSADKTIWNRKTNVVTLTGTARVSQPGETVEADHIVLDLNSRELDADGNCRYRAADTLIESREMHFNLDTRTGSIVGGRVTNGRFLLLGERINKLGDGRFQTHSAEYTTCRDCPGSWSLSGNDVDLQFEGYAYMSNVTAKVKGAPVLWMPYVILPIKSRRQTGLLFPRFGTSELHGFRFVQPFFWATGRSTDMTFGLGLFGARGLRTEWEGRYAISNESKGTANVFLIQDSKTDAPVSSRWSVKILQSNELPFGIMEKLRFYEVSDNLYPIQFSQEDSFPGRREPVLTSDLSFSKHAPGASAYVAGMRFRNLLTSSKVAFDDRTVQVFPKVNVATNDTRLFGSPFVAGLNVTLDNFTRAAGPFDYDNCDTGGSCPNPGDPYRPGTDPIREATRVSVTPSVYATMRLWDALAVVPSVEYRSYFYSFHQALPDLTRGYLRFRTDMSLSLEKVYETENPDIPRVKHVIQPLLTYSNIPFVHQPSHSFLSQVKYRNGFAFDTQDTVPFGRSPSLVNYFVPQGNSISYAVSTQLIRRRGAMNAPDATYQRFIEFRAGQTVDFLEFDKAEEKQAPLSRLDAWFGLTLDKLSFSSQYYYYPDLDRLLAAQGSSSVANPSPHVVSSSLGYTMESAMHQDVLRFERSVSLNHTWSRINSETNSISGKLTYSINDYFTPSIKATYDLRASGERQGSGPRLLEVVTALDVQSPSRCWKITGARSQSVDRKSETSIEININLTGEGFGSFDSLVGSIPK